MRRLHFLLLAAAACLVFASAPSATAMIAFAGIDHPRQIGYNISAKAVGADVLFTVDLNDKASAALHKYPPEILVRSPGELAQFQKLKIKVLVTQTPDKRKHLAFTVPAKLLHNCYLRVSSDTLRDSDFMRNVVGYELLLDHVLK